jgi:hypothetical protein
MAFRNALLHLGYHCCRASAEPEVTEKVFFDVTVGGAPAGRIVLGVYGNDTPKTAANFVALGRFRST